MGKQQQGEEFDLKVHTRDEKSGAIIDSNPYTMTVISNEQGRTRIFERPPGSGNLFDKNNNPIGRWDYSKDAKGKKTKSWNQDAKHLAFEKPLTNDQKLARQVIEKDAEIAELRAALAAKEVAAIKAENQKDAGPQLPEKDAEPKETVEQQVLEKDVEPKDKSEKKSQSKNKGDGGKKA